MKQFKSGNRSDKNAIQAYIISVAEGHKTTKYDFIVFYSQ